MRIIHNLDPIYNNNSKVLILGSLPSIESRKQKFYYMNKQNRFWKIMENLYEVELNTTQDKVKFLYKNNIALWDVISSCDITNSSDSSIKNVIPNNIKELVDNSKVTRIFCLGKTAFNLYNKYIKNINNIDLYYLPSSSSANAKYSLTELTNFYKIIKKEDI